MAIASVLGTVMLTAYANSEDTSTNEETDSICLPLTDEQRAELKTMREEFRNAVQEKLNEWGVEAPEFPSRMGGKGFGPMRGGCGGFGFSGFQMP